MKCYHHPDRDAVAVCTECGRGLCKECASFYAKPFCPECAVSKALRIKQNLEKACLLFVALAVVFLIVIVTTRLKCRQSMCWFLRCFLPAYLLAGIS